MENLSNMEADELMRRFLQQGVPPWQPIPSREVAAWIGVSLQDSR